MKLTRILPGIALVALVVAASAVFVRHRELRAARFGYQEVMDRLANASASPGELPLAPVAQKIDDGAPSSDLLRLRNEVTRLMQRTNELRGVQAEHDALLAQWVHRTNNPARLPAGYIRRTEARWVGMNTPENTVQSFLWAVQTKNPSNVVQVLTPKSAERLLEALRSNPELFERDTDALPGLRPLTQTLQPDGSIEMAVEILPGAPNPEEFTLRLIDGQWKLDI